MVNYRRIKKEIFVLNDEQKKGIYFKIMPNKTIYGLTFKNNPDCTGYFSNNKKTILKSFVNDLKNGEFTNKEFVKLYYK